MSTENNDKTFTQKEVDEIVKNRLGKEEKKHSTLLKSIEEELNQKIKELEESNKSLSEKAIKAEGLSTKLEEVTGELAVLQSEKEQREFNEKLKGLDIKEERLEAFSKMLGDKRDDDSIKAVKEQFPEWVNNEEPQDPNPAPAPKFVAGGDPNPAPPTETIDPFLQGLGITK